MYSPISMEVLKKDFPHYSGVQWLTVCNLLFYYVLMLLALSGAWKAASNRTLWLLVLIPLLGTLFIALVGHGEVRYHQPFMPFLIMLAAWRIKTWRDTILSGK